MQNGKKIKINFKDLALEKKVSRKIIPTVIKEVVMGSVSTTELLQLMNKKN